MTEWKPNPALHISESRSLSRRACPLPLTRVCGYPGTSLTQPVSKHLSFQGVDLGLSFMSRCDGLVTFSDLAFYFRHTLARLPTFRRLLHLALCGVVMAKVPVGATVVARCRAMVYGRVTTAVAGPVIPAPKADE